MLLVEGCVVDGGCVILVRMVLTSGSGSFCLVLIVGLVMVRDEEQSKSLRFLGLE